MSAKQKSQSEASGKGTDEKELAKDKETPSVSWKKEARPETPLRETVVEEKAKSKAPEKAVGAGVTAKEKEVKPAAEAEGEKKMSDRKVNLKTLARDLYQMGLELGLPPDEAALLTSETKLPTFIGREDKNKFKQGLVEAYQEMLDERLQDLKQKLGVS